MKTKIFFHCKYLTWVIFLNLLVLFSIARKTFGQSSSNFSKTNSRPNIIFLLVDDLGWTDINSFDPLNREYYETPNIDRLVQQGMMFTQAYSSAANCTPSRAAIMSGQQYPHQPIYNVGTHPRPGLEKSLISAHNAAALPLTKITLSEALKRGRYKTGFIGKWGIGDPPKTGPKQQGFDINIGGYIAHNPSSWKGGYYKPNNNPYIHDAHKGEYLTDYLTRKAQAFIRTNQKGPFYLQLSYYTVHQPLQAKKKLEQKYKNKKEKGGHDNPAYAAMIESLDQNVGKLMHTLKTLEIAKNTIIIFFSDNGGVGGYGYLGRHDHITDNSPLKGGKTTFYEGGIRVPLIVRWPQVIKPGSRCDQAVIATDFYPTLLDAAGIEKPKKYALDGQSLLPLFRDSNYKLVDRSLYWHFPGYPNNVWRTGPVSVIRNGRWKLMKYYEDFYKSGKIQLYNTNKDVSEQHDVSGSYPEVRNKLQTQLEIWLKKNNAPMPKKSQEEKGFN